MTISVKKLQKTTLNVFAGTVGQSKRLEALEIVVVHVNHEYVYTDNGDGTHTGRCVCGDTLEPESCSYEYEPIEGTEKEHHQICSVCGSEKENSKESCSGEKCVQVDAEHHNVVCDKCENILEENKEHQYGKYENVESYVSSENFGTHKRTCDLCGYEDEEKHNYSSVSGYIPHTQTEKGGAGTTMTCSVCGDTVKFIVREDEDFNHEFTYIYDQATDTHKKTCKVCGLTETESCDYEVMNDGDTGTHSIVCKNCKGVKAVHKWKKTQTNIREDGSTAPKEHYKYKYTCADDENCDAIKTTEEHHYLQMPEKEATCTKDGYKAGLVCLACGEIKNKDKIIPATGKHTYEKYISVEGDNIFEKQCTVCGNYSGEKKTLEDALKDANTTTNREVELNCECTINEDITIPEDVTLHIGENGNLKCNGDEKHTIKENGELTIDENGTFDKSNISITQDPDAEIVEKLETDVKSLSKEYGKGQVIESVEYNEGTNTFTFKVKNDNKSISDLYYGGGMTYMNDIFSEIDKGATKAELIKDGNITVFDNSDRLDNFIQNLIRTYILKNISNIKDNNYVLRLHFNDEVNNFEYYIDYTIKFVG